VSDELADWSDDRDELDDWGDELDDMLGVDLDDGADELDEPEPFSLRPFDVRLL